MPGRKNTVVLYEINSPVFLSRLSQKHGRPISLGEVPDDEIGRLAALGVDAIWLMGVWERSPAAIAIGQDDVHLQKLLRKVLPDFDPEDFIGSAYSVRDYRPAEMLGGEAGLAAFRKKLESFGMGLVLDFVPNHTAPDHTWAFEHPEFYINGSEKDSAKRPESFLSCGENILARGRDPEFEPWSDVVQLNAFSVGYRQAAIDTINRIAQFCDGVRCDMAMLMMNRIFAKTWGGRAGAKPPADFWEEVIAGVRAEHPGFVFLAESYWDTEKELVAQGFDYCYDKTFYDILLEKDGDAALRYLLKTATHQKNMAHFIENHDEERAASAFTAKKMEAAATLTAAAPGLWLLHDGQMEGYKTRIPVHLARGPEEPADPQTYKFYEKLLALVSRLKSADIIWQPLRTGRKNLVAYMWLEDGAKNVLLANYGNTKLSLRVDFIPGMRQPAAYELGPWQILTLASKNPAKV